MLVMTASTGVRRRNVRSYSSASTMMRSPSPETAFVAPNEATLPPTMIVGSKSSSPTTRPTIVVVVVLPWVPAMPMPYFIRMSSPSMSARRMSGMRWRSASFVSAFWSGLTALE